MRSFLQIIFRILFALSIIALSTKILYDVNKHQSFVSQTIDQIQHQILKKDFSISFLKQYSQEIVFGEAFLFYATALFTVFGFCTAKVTAFLAIFIELALIHNPYFYREPNHIITASSMLGIFGGVLCL